METLRKVKYLVATRLSDADEKYCIEAMNRKENVQISFSELLQKLKAEGWNPLTELDILNAFLFEKWENDFPKEISRSKIGKFSTSILITLILFTTFLISACSIDIGLIQQNEPSISSTQSDKTLHHSSTSFTGNIHYIGVHETTVRTNARISR